MTVGNRWLRENGILVNDLDGRAALLEDLAPGSQIELLLPITAPKERGTYILQIDAIQEGVAWFGDRGSEALTVRVNIQ